MKRVVNAVVRIEYEQDDNNYYADMPLSEKDLCSDLDKDIEDVARRLEQFSKDHNFSMEEVEDLCWMDSSWMFNQIY